MDAPQHPLATCDLEREALSHGFRTLRMDGAIKVQRHITTLDEILRVTQLDVV